MVRWQVVRWQDGTMIGWQLALRSPAIVRAEGLLSDVEGLVESGRRVKRTDLIVVQAL